MHEATTAWIIDPRSYAWALAAWSVIVLLYGLWRSVARPDPDPHRPAGPIERAP